MLERVDPERAHRLATLALRALAAAPPVRALLRRLLAPRDERLRVRALGLDLPTPLGVAGGFDKDAGCYEALTAIGFGFVEVGTVTARPQEGNARPRVFRLPRARAIVNRMGFPNPGAAAVAARLAGRAPGAATVGVNVGKTRAAPIEDAAADYRESVRALAPHADYLVLNVSSPNTPGLRDMQAAEPLAALVGAVREELGGGDGEGGGREGEGGGGGGRGRGVPLLVKIGPDLADAELDAVVDTALELGLDGIVAVNTTVPDEETMARVEGLRELVYGAGAGGGGASAGGMGGGRESANRTGGMGGIGAGGLSGAPLKERSLEVLRRLRARAGGRLTLISVGGIEDAADAWERLEAGATLVQAYTGFAYGGPLWPRRVNRGLSAHVREAGMASIEEAIGLTTAASRG